MKRKKEENPEYEMPIEAMNENYFNHKLKPRLLNKDKLSDSDLEEIVQLFNIRKIGHYTCEIDEQDGHCSDHGYKCVNYRNPIAGVVDRLLYEIREYREESEKIKKFLKKAVE